MEDLSSSTPFLDSATSSSPPSPTARRAQLSRTHSTLSQHDERTPLLQSAGRSRIRLQSMVENTKPPISRHHSRNGKHASFVCHWILRLTMFPAGSLRSYLNTTRESSWSQRLANALKHDGHIRDPMKESKGSLYPDERVWYDQFTSTDWVHDSIADAYRVKALRSRTDIRGRIKAFFDSAQGWILSALVGVITAVIAYIVDVSEAPVFDWKDGYCSKGFLISEKVSG